MLKTRGRGIDFQNFVKRLRALAEKKDDSYAQYRLAKLYEKGEGVARDIETSIYWYLRSLSKSNYASYDFAKIVEKYPKLVSKVRSKMQET
jgi:TPR repeat protein